MDQHNAAATGKISEELFKYEVESVGITFLKTREDYREWNYRNENGARGSLGRGNDIYESHMVQWPEAWQKVTSPTPSGRKRRFNVDGWIPELDTRVEVKYSEKNGTTEEKVFFDYVKIRDGVYDGKPLLYVLFGSNAPGKAVFELFKHMVDSLGRDDVHVIIDDESLSQTKKYLAECLEFTNE